MRTDTLIKSLSAKLRKQRRLKRIDEYIESKIPDNKLRNKVEDEAPSKRLDLWV